MNRSRLLAAAALVAIPAAASAAEYVVEPFEEGWIEPPPRATSTNPTGSSLVLGPRQDAVTSQVTLPFKFSVFGSLRDRISISDDGWLAFGPTSRVEGENPALPSARPAEARFAIVAPLWDDLRTRGDGEIVTFVKGTAPARTFVVAWRHMDTASRASRADVSFEVILHEGTGLIEVAYEQGGTWEGLSFTTGLQDPTGARAFGAPNLAATNSAEPASDQRFVANAVDVTGKVLRDRPLATETGLGTQTELGVPVRGARVELVREDTGEAFASALTDQNGDFTAVALGIDGAPSLAVDLVAAGAESVVTSADNTPYRHRIATSVVPAGAASIGEVTLGDAVDAANPSFRKALNIQQAAQRGHAFVIAAANTEAGTTRNFPQLEFRWVAGQSAASGYVAATSTFAARATISDSPPDPDPYDDDVILRAYASHVYATLTTYPSGTFSNSWVNASGSEQVGFVEGFAFWFACAVQERAKFINTRNPALTPNDPSPAVVFDLEAPMPAATGAATAGAVAASLWDLVDDANEPRDDFAGTLPDSGHEVIVTLDRRRGATTMPSTATPWTTATFLLAWRQTGSAAERAATSRAFIAAGTLADDTSEPNDEAGEETPFDEVTRRMTGLVLNPFNEDRFSFTLGEDPLAVSASFPEASEVEISILDAEGTVVATAASGTVRSPVVVNTPAELAPGTYTARVAWKSGPAAHYALGIATRVVLVTSSLPQWTAGESFNVTLETTGGIAPVTFGISPEVPEGLTLVPGSGRLTGRPAAGTYDLDVVATDGSGSGPQTIGTLQLVVNPALRLADPIAVAAGRTVAIDVGSGGTVPQWTASGPVPPGMTLTGGSTLRLAGPSGSPRAFQVTGSALDSVGAAIPQRSAFVVVAAPVAEARGSVFDTERPFGFWFDAIQGSSASFDFAFDRGSKGPELLVLDAAGARLPAAGAIERRAGRVTVRNLPITATGRYFLVFRADEDESAALRVTSARARVRPVRRVAGIANIGEAGAHAEIRFHAVEGSRLRVVMRRGLAPVAADPDFIEVEDPNGARIEPLPQGRYNKSRTRKVVSGIVLPDSGEYVVRVGGRDTSTGALSYVVEIVAPPGAPFSID
jgi:hypothetical protein